MKFPSVERGELRISETDIEVLGLKANSLFNCFIEAVGECCEYYYLESSYQELSDTFLETVTKASATNIIDANGEQQPFAYLSFKDRMALKAG